jgi:hypothetical protein
MISILNGIQFLRFLMLLKRSLQDDDLFYDGIESLCYVFYLLCVYVYV